MIVIGIRAAGISATASIYRPLWAHAVSCWGRRRQHRHRHQHYSSTTAASTQSKISAPLRILFCGSDDFSCASLQALQREHAVNPGLIESIDVVARPGKPIGRGNKTMRWPPIHGIAKELGLPLHEQDTFTGWTPPSFINLIIAVSFGLFVPPRLLSAAHYGGLNVHPSLLPDFRGPAPLQHTLLARRPYTGVTLQTLDPVTFDHGVVLAQTSPEDGLIRIPPSCTVPQLLDLVTPVSAELLVQGLRDGVHVPPLEDKGWFSPAASGSSSQKTIYNAPPSPSITHAPKIRSGDRQIVSTMPEADIPLRQRVIGPLWFYGLETSNKKPSLDGGVEGQKKEVKRVIITEILEDGSPASDTAGGSYVSIPFYNAATEEQKLSEKRVEKKDQEDSAEEAKQENHLPLSLGTELRPWISNDPKDEALYFCGGGGGPDDGSGNKGPSPFFRITQVKVEGQATKPARTALAKFMVIPAAPAAAADQGV